MLALSLAPAASPELESADADHALAAEMTAAGADWQIHAYGSTYHSFTNEHANAPGTAMYNAAADKRSWAAMTGLLAETL